MNRDTPVVRFARGAWPYALLIAIGLFILLPNLGEYGFWDPWEPKYAEASREMIERAHLTDPPGGVARLQALIEADI